MAEDSTLASTPESAFSSTATHLHQDADSRDSYPHRISDAGYTAVALCLTIVWVFGTLFNVTCLGIFAVNKQLRSPTNTFIIALNTCDLLMSFVASFLVMTSAWKGRWIWGFPTCVAEGFLVYLLGLTSMYILAAISLDRYVVIAKPLLSHKITHRVAGIAVGGCWAGGAVWSVMPLLGWNEYVMEGAGLSCSVVWESRDPVYSSYIFTIFVFCLCLPLTVMVFSYYNVFMTIRSMSRNQIWGQNSRIAKKNLKIEKKMVRTIAFMLAGFLCCWLPYAIFSLIVVFKGSGAVSPELATYPAILAKSQGLINPIVYVATNKQFRLALYEMLPCARLRNALKKREEQHADTDESDADESDADESKWSSQGKKSNNKRSGSSDDKTAKGKALASGNSKKGSKSFKNTVHPLPEESAEAGEGNDVKKTDVVVSFRTVQNSVDNNAVATGDAESVEIQENGHTPAESADPVTKGEVTVPEV
ncbi:hypothetical protein BaRGS_00012038 [Batillaria attramentaria]|uniref:G-protein coupled receptors family 1 profile domain-containing protein n=1 Tax=Batillaria attramentaria TaxID=370345 RepID=A0ABD0LAN9_9CAEN